MKGRQVFLTVALACLSATMFALPMQVDRPRIRIAVTGESNLKTNFIEDLRAAAVAAKVVIEIVPRTDETRAYTLIIAQESTLGSAAAAVIGLDTGGDVALSVVRSGRFSGRGALNACAKEVIKKIAVLAK